MLIETSQVGTRPPAADGRRGLRLVLCGKEEATEQEARGGELNQRRKRFQAGPRSMGEMGRSRTHARATAKGNIYDVEHAPAAYLARGGG